MPAPADSLRAEIERAAEGLVYLSEADHPFRWVDLGDAPDLEGALRARLALPAGTRVERTTLDRFLAGHIEESDPDDPVMAARVPRYRALRELLRERLRDVTVLRVGEVEIGCYVLGRTADGRVVGLATTAVET